MKKVIRLTESDLVRIVKRIITESEGDLNNPGWNKIKNEFMSKGFEYFTYTEKRSGGITNLVTTGKNSMKNYQRCFIKNNDNLYIQYPYFKSQGGPLDYNKVGIVPSDEKDLTPAFHNSLVRKYSLKYNELPMAMDVSNSNSVINLVNDLLMYYKGQPQKS